MITRRTLLKQLAVFSAGSMLVKDSFAGHNAPSKKVGLQLYTLRNDMGKTPLETLQKVAELGYGEVENFGYGNGKFFGMEPKIYRENLDKLGLSAVSGHYMMGSMANWQQVVDDAAAIGQKYMVIAFLLPNERKTIDDYKKVAESLNKGGETCKKAGIQLCYHNHDFEFQPIDGQLPFDLLMQTDKDLVKTELDLYWAVKAGYQPVDLFNKYPGRVVLWHVKDMDNTDKKFFTEVGNGTIDFRKIFSNAKKSGMEHFFVEQDVCPGPPLDSITKSIGYIKSTLVPLLA